MTEHNKPEGADQSNQAKVIHVELVQPRTGNEIELGYQPPKAELQPPTPPVTQTNQKPTLASNSSEQSNDRQTQAP